MRLSVFLGASLLAFGAACNAHAAEAEPNAAPRSDESVAIRPQTPEDEKFDRLARQLYDETLALDPDERLKSSGLGAETRWTPASDTYRLQRERVAQAQLKHAAGAIAEARLSPRYRVRYLTLMQGLHGEVLKYRIIREGSSLQLNFSDPVWVYPQTLKDSPLRSQADGLGYIARVRGLAAVLADVAAAGDVHAARGTVLPAEEYRQLARQAKELSAGAPCAGEGANPLASDFAGKLGGLDLPEAGRAKLQQDLDQALKDDACPAFAALAKKLDQWAPAGRASGLWEIPQGDQVYRDVVEYFLGERVDPEVIFAFGQQEVRKLRGELSVATAKVGYSGDLNGFAAFAAANTALSVPNNDDGYRESERRVRQDLENVSALLPQYFDYIPKGRMDIQRALRGPTGGPAPMNSFYNPVPKDGSRPAAYMLAFPQGQPRVSLWSSPTITYHEALPGHHFQFATASESDPNGDLVRRSELASYVEGWGLYAEQLADEMGMYKDDPYGRIGMLNARLERAVRLVVDTGLNFKHWSPEQAKAYQDASMIYTRPVSLTRFLNWPGQALGYYWGYVELLRLREEARAELGQRFDIKGFHSAVLLPGPMPPAALRLSVLSWIDGVKTGAARRGGRK